MGRNHGSDSSSWGSDAEDPRKRFLEAVGSADTMSKPETKRKAKAKAKKRGAATQLRHSTFSALSLEVTGGTRKGLQPLSRQSIAELQSEWAASKAKRAAAEASKIVDSGASTASTMPSEEEVALPEVERECPDTKGEALRLVQQYQQQVEDTLSSMAHIELKLVVEKARLSVSTRRLRAALTVVAKMAEVGGAQHCSTQNERKPKDGSAVGRKRGPYNLRDCSCRKGEIVHGKKIKTHEPHCLRGKRYKVVAEADEVD